MIDYRVVLLRVNLLVCSKHSAETMITPSRKLRKKAILGGSESLLSFKTQQPFPI